MQRHLAVALATALTAAGLAAGPVHADREVVVQPGENMRGISLRYYGDEEHVWAITRYNHLQSPDLIYTGLRLILPDLPPDDQAAGPDSSGDANASQPTTFTSANTSTDSIGDTATSAGPPPMPAEAAGSERTTMAFPVLLGPASPQAAPGVAVTSDSRGASIDVAVPGVPLQSGMATWYGPGFNGNYTFCGEIFQEWGYTAASNTLPCGTVVVVTNQSTGTSVTVRVNDRGGFGSSLILDLSRGAFDAIAPEYFGVISVTISLPGR